MLNVDLGVVGERGIFPKTRRFFGGGPHFTPQALRCSSDRPLGCRSFDAVHVRRTNCSSRLAAYVGDLGIDDEWNGQTLAYSSTRSMLPYDSCHGSGRSLMVASLSSGSHATTSISVLRLLRYEGAMRHARLVGCMSSAIGKWCYRISLSLSGLQPPFSMVSAFFFMPKRYPAYKFLYRWRKTPKHHSGYIWWLTGSISPARGPRQ